MFIIFIIIIILNKLHDYNDLINFKRKQIFAQTYPVNDIFQNIILHSSLLQDHNISINNNV